MENDGNATASTDNNGAATNTGADTGAASADNNQTQSQDTNQGGDQGATSQSNNSSSSNANEDVDYSTLVPQVTIDHSGEQIPDPVKDPAAYAEFVNNDADRRAQFRSSEVRGWQTLEKEFPEIKTNEQLRKNILALRTYNAQNGIEGGVVEAGRQIMSPVSQAHASGKTDAQVSIEEQQRAGLNRGTAPQNTQPTTQKERLERFRRGDQDAGRSMVEQMLKDKII